MSFKFSLRDLLITIALISVACAALANSGIWWHSIIVTATLTGMTGILLWGSLQAGTSRAFASGWLLFAGGYLSLVFGPWTGNNLGVNFITSKGFSQLEMTTRGDNLSPPVLNSGQSMGYQQLSANLGSNPSLKWTSYPPTSVWNFSEPNWVDHCTTFQSTGHWLFASVFGYCGAHLAAFLFRRRQAKCVSTSGSA